MVTWQFNESGPRAGVIHALKSVKVNPETGSSKQFSAAASEIIRRIEALNAKFNSAKVIAHGEWDEASGRDVTQIDVYGHNLALVPEPETKKP